MLISGKIDKKIVIDSLLPETIERFPWGGHLGVRMVQPVVEHIKRAKSTLIFTNTRSQAEMLFQNLWAINEDSLAIALHHALYRQLGVLAPLPGSAAAGALACSCTTNSLPRP